MHHSVIQEKDEDGKIRSVETRKKLAYDLTMVTALIDGADQSQYGTLITELANQHAKGRNEHPKDLLSAQSLLVMYKTPASTSRSSGGSGSANRVNTPPPQPAPQPAQRRSLSAILPPKHQYLPSPSSSMLSC